MADETFDPLTPMCDVRLDPQAHVRIEGQQAPPRLALEQCQERRADRLYGQRVGAGVKAPDRGIDAGQVALHDGPVGRALSIEGIDGPAIGPHVNDGQRGRPGAAHEQAGCDPLGLESVVEPLAEAIRREPGEQGRGLTESREPHRHVEG